MVAWISSEGRRLLFRDIRKGVITKEMSWEDVFFMREEFAVGDTPDEAYRLFQGRLASAFKIAEERDKRQSSELDMLRQDRQIYPVPKTNQFGERRWDGSAAQTQLKKDVDDGLHLNTNKHAFYSLHPDVYKAFKVDTIWAHVEQEVRLRKFKKQYGHRGGYWMPFDCRKQPLI